jgi:hypothetical protein
MNESIRAQVYYKDSGLLRKSYIQHMTKEDFDQVNKCENTKAVELNPDNWYGENLPDTLR